MIKVSNFKKDSPFGKTNYRPITIGKLSLNGDYTAKYMVNFIDHRILSKI